MTARLQAVVSRLVEHHALPREDLERQVRALRARGLSDDTAAELLLDLIPHERDPE